jgi:hypothetical protein
MYGGGGPKKPLGGVSTAKFEVKYMLAIVAGLRREGSELLCRVRCSSPQHQREKVLEFMLI